MTRRTPAVTPTHDCPCGTDAPYQQCCGRYHQHATAPTPEALMRARYTAYVLQDHAFILATWHATTRPAQSDPAGDAGQTHWLGLAVRAQEQHGDKGVVEFVARYKTGGRAQRLHEISRFVREGGQWWYVDGRFPEPGRDPK